MRKCAPSHGSPSGKVTPTGAAAVMRSCSAATMAMSEAARLTP